MYLSPSFLYATASIVTLVCSSGELAAQVPPNHLVGGTRPGNNIGTSGLFYTSLATGKVTRVTGLPSTFVKSSGWGGVTSVLRRSDERLVLGNAALGQQALTLSMFTMKGSAVDPSHTKTAVLGFVPAGYRMYTSAATLMPDGRRVLVGTAATLTGGPMAGHRLGIVDLDAAPPTVTPIKLLGVLAGAYVVQAAIDPAGAMAYVTTYTGGSDVRPFRLYMIDMKTGAVALLYTESVRYLSAIRLIGEDRLICSAVDLYATSTPKPTDLMQFRITGWGRATLTRLTLKSTEGLFASTALDIATGEVIMGASDFVNFRTPNPGAGFKVNIRTGQVKLFARPPAGGFGNPACADIHGSLDEYGHSPQQHEIGYQVPNPGGAPKAGNALFSLTLDSRVAAPRVAVGIFLLGLKPLSVSIAGTRLLVDPLLVFPLASLPKPGIPVTIPLPLPRSLPIGSKLYAQWLSCAAGTCKGSRGMKVVIQ